MTARITKYNAEGLCIEKTCSSRYTRFAVVEINGLDCYLPFCDKHADHYDRFLEEGDTSFEVKE